jgi:hypothetical protein
MSNMPFGIPSEDFHDGFGLPHDDDCIEECIHTPEKAGTAMKHISELMDKHRAEHPEVYIVDAEYESAAEEAHDNLVRSLVEAGGEIRELNDEKKRLIFALKEAVTWLDYFLTTERDDIYYDEASEARWRAECLLMDMEDTE